MREFSLKMTTDRDARRVDATENICRSETTTCLHQVTDLSRSQRNELFELMQRSYEGVNRKNFDQDLAEKHWVITVSDEQGVLRGFSTQMLLPSRDYPNVDALFSGDTIVDPAWWNKHDLSGVWGRMALALIDRQAGRRLVWFLISKGYKTYRYLPLFFHQFYPRFDQSTPLDYKELLDSLGRQKFGERYDAAAGIVRAGQGSYRLRAQVAPLDQRRLQSPHVRYFAERNPGYVIGDELCCIAPLTRSNFTPAAFRVIAAASRDSSCCLD